MSDQKPPAPRRPQRIIYDRAHLSFDWSKMVVTVEEIAQFERARPMLAELFGPGALNRKRAS